MQEQSKPNAKPIATLSPEEIRRLRNAQLEQRFLALARQLQELREECKELRSDYRDEMRGKILDLVAWKQYVHARLDRLDERLGDFATALTMLQGKSESLRRDYADTERRLLERIHEDAQDRRGLVRWVIGLALSSILTVIGLIAAYLSQT